MSLEIEGLGKTIQLDDEMSFNSTTSVGSEVRAHQEMQRNGMSLPQQGIGSVSAQSFADLLDGAVQKVNEHQQQADFAIKELVAGRNKNIHETMLAIERADLSMKLMVQVRNKMLDAYREIMRMQV